MSREANLCIWSFDGGRTVLIAQSFAMAVAGDSEVWIEERDCSLPCFHGGQGFGVQGGVPPWFDCCWRMAPVRLAAPLEKARKAGHTDVVELLQAAGARSITSLPRPVGEREEKERGQDAFFTPSPSGRGSG